MNRPIDEYRELISNYESGLYTDIELISKTFAMLGEGEEEVWAESPEWVKAKIRDKLASIGDEDEFVSFSNRSSDEIRRQLLSLKSLLDSKGCLVVG
ncbi:MAG: hypothetical protein VYA55_03925 [Pseudomonadota bacterium]|nr:hypothetical protein [Pseudomonadota bacterium]